MKEFESESTISLKKATLLLLVREGEVLLAMKKRGFGMGKWNGLAENQIQEKKSLKQQLENRKRKLE